MTFPLLPSPAPDTQDPANFTQNSNNFFGGMVTWAQQAQAYLLSYQIQLNGTTINNTIPVSGGFSARMFSGLTEIVEMPNMRVGGVVPGSALQSALDGKANRDGGNFTNALRAKSGDGGPNNPSDCGFVFQGDPDTGLFNPADGQMRGYVNGMQFLNVLNNLIDFSVNGQLRVSISAASGSITLHRTDSAGEGGQANFTRALDDAVAWSVDVLGALGVTNLRFINTFAGEAVMELLGSSGRVYTKYGFQFQDGSTQSAAGLGFGQSWQNVAASRAANTAYQNTTGRPIALSIRPAASNTLGSLVQVSADGTNWLTVHLIDNSTHYGGAIVPPGHYYRFNQAFSAWVELR